MAPQKTPISFGQAFKQAGQNLKSGIAGMNPLGAIGSVVSGVSGGIAGAISARKNRKHQEKMQKQQFDFAREMFDKTNQWNSPANQVRLKREAGLNPYYDDSSAFVATSAVPAGTAPNGNAQGGALFSQGLGNLGNTLNQSASLDLDRFRSETDYAKALAEIGKIDNDIVRDKYYMDLDRDRLDMEFQESVARIGEMAQNVLTSKSVQYFNDVKTQQAAVDIVRNWLDSVSYRNLNAKQGKVLDSQELLNIFEAHIKSPHAALGAMEAKILKNPSNRKALVALASFALREPKLRYELDEAMNISARIRNNREGFSAVTGGIVGAFSPFAADRRQSRQFEHDDMRQERQFEHVKNLRKSDRAYRTRRDKRIYGE